MQSELGLKYIIKHSNTLLDKTWGNITYNVLMNRTVSFYQTLTRCTRWMDKSTNRVGLANGIILTFILIGAVFEDGRTNQLQFAVAISENVFRRKA